MSEKFDYYYGNDEGRYSFFRIPKALFTDETYKSISLEAKVLYGLLLDRMSLSVRNGWMDAYRRVFIYFTLEDVQNNLRCGHNKASALMGELDRLGLIERKKQGQGKPTKIYVKKMVGEDTQTSEKGKSALPENGSQDFPKPDANKTEKNNTEQNHTEPSIPLPPSTPTPPVADRPRGTRNRRIRMDEMDSCRELIKDNIEYDVLLEDNPFDQDVIDGYVELMTEVCCSGRDYTRISGEDIPIQMAKKRLLKLNCEHISYVMESMRNNAAHVSNIKAYTLAALYNAPVTMGQYYAAQVGCDMAQQFKNR